MIDRFAFLFSWTHASVVTYTRPGPGVANPFRDPARAWISPPFPGAVRLLILILKYIHKITQSLKRDDLRFKHFKIMKIEKRCTKLPAFGFYSRVGIWTLDSIPNECNKHWLSKNVLTDQAKVPQIAGLKLYLLIQNKKKRNYWLAVLSKQYKLYRLDNELSWPMQRSVVRVGH